jgi:hypothetical protein
MSIATAVLPARQSFSSTRLGGASFSAIYALFL